MTPDKYLDALRTHWKANKSFPSMAKLADVLGLASSGGVFKVLGRLVDQGYLERVDGGIRRTFEDEDDRKDALEEDRQGLGLSRERQQG